MPALNLALDPIPAAAAALALAAIAAAIAALGQLPCRCSCCPCAIGLERAESPLLQAVMANPLDRRVLYMEGLQYDLPKERSAALYSPTAVLPELAHSAATSRAQLRLNLRRRLGGLN